MEDQIVDSTRNIATKEPECDWNAREAEYYRIQEILKDTGGFSW